MAYFKCRRVPAPTPTPTPSDYLYNWDKTPIYDIYLSDEMTKDTIKLGELEEYSNLNIKVPHKDIYKWKNKYINVKRLIWILHLMNKLKKMIDKKEK